MTFLLAAGGMVVMGAALAGAAVVGVASADSLAGMASACITKAREWSAAFLGEGGITGLALLVVLLFSLGVFRGVRAFLAQWSATSRLVAALMAARVGAGAPISALSALSGQVGLTGRVDLIGDDRLFVFTHGFVRPRVLVSSGLVRHLAKSELLAVLWHEKHHVMRRDPLWVALARAVCAAVPLKAFGDLAELHDIGKELAADEFAARRMGEAGPLLWALARLAEAGSSPVPAAAAGLGGAEGMALRLQHLLAWPAPWVSPAERVSLRAPAALLGLALLALSAVWVLARWFGPVAGAAACAAGLCGMHGAANSPP